VDRYSVLFHRDGSRRTAIVIPVISQLDRLTQGQGIVTRPLMVPMVLTQSNRSAGRDRVRTAPVRAPRAQGIEAPAGCRECGVVLEDRRRRREASEHYAATETRRSGMG
jgi:hypothetical protein